MNKNELNKLLNNVALGDEESFNKLYYETYKGIFSFIYSYTKDYAITEDLVQDTFMKIKKNAYKYKENNPSAWILQIAKFTTLDYLRDKNNKKTIPLDEANISQTEDLDIKMDINRIMDLYLEEDDKRIIILHVQYGYKHREIADILNIPLGTVLWKYDLAIKTLKEALNK